jgi:hypothetical protein
MPPRTLPVALVVAVALAGSPLSRGAAAADPGAVLSRAKQATGGDRWDAVKTLVVRGKLRAGGLEGGVESWSDLRTGRNASRYVLGPAKGAEGFDGKRAWSQDDSGQVRIEGSADAREAAADEAYRTARAYWFPERWKARIEDGGEQRDDDRRFAVVRITPEGGRPFDLWIDERTGLPDRYAEQGATRLRTTFLSDYREVSGVRIPFQARSTTGDPKYDDVFTVEKVSLDEPIEDARFSPPPPPPPDYELAGDVTTVPFELVNNHIYVDVRLNGKGPFRLLCDTGGANIATPELAKELGLQPEGALEGRGVGEKSEDVALARMRSVELGGVTLKDQLFMIFPLATLSAVEGVPVHGLVGYEVFKRFVVTIDYAARRLTIRRPGTFAAPAGAKAVPFRFDGHTPEVDGTLDGIPGSFALDTGSRVSLSVLAPFAERHGLAKRYGAKVEAVTGWGVGGPARGLVARAGKLTLGDVVIEAPVVDLSVQKKGAFSDRYGAGNVGGGVLKRFTVTFDYAAQKVWFEPNASARARDPYDRSGLWLNLAGGAFEVIDVVAGGPGAKAGLAKGDRILAVDGKPAADVTLPAAREKLRTGAPGTKVRLTVESKGARRDVTLVLADLV